MPRPRLAEDALAEALATLPQWARESERLVRVFKFSTFSDAMHFVNQVATHAEAARHHPDMDIRYTQVTVAYWSHDAGGITRADVKAAAAIDALHGAAGA